MSLTEVFLSCIALFLGILTGLRISDWNRKRRENITASVSEKWESYAVQQKEWASAILSKMDYLVANQVTGQHIREASEKLANFVQFGQPIVSLLSSIEAESKLTRQKLDVLYEVMGIDKRTDLPQYVDDNPERDTGNVFQEMVLDEMREQGTNYAQAVSVVKSRMAHRRTGR